MPTTFRPHQPEQTLLLPPDLREWLPEGHLAEQVSDLVDGLDLMAFCAPHEGDGLQAGVFSFSSDSDAVDYHREIRYDPPRNSSIRYLITKRG